MSKHLVCYLTSLFSLCLLSGCHSRQSPDKVLLYADSLMELYPDSTLLYLQSLDVSGFSESDKVYYGLLLTQATDKNYLPLLPCDSLVEAALNYYDEGDGLLRAKALLYKSRIQQSMKMPTEAMENCFEGLKELGDSPKELQLKRMLYEDLGGIYQSQSIEDKALDMFQSSYRCDSLLNDEKLLKYSIVNIGWQHVILGNEEFAKEYLHKALQMALEQNDSLFIYNTYHRLSINSENTDSAFVYVRLACRYQTEKVDSIGLFLSLGDLFLELHELDSAELYLKRVLNSSDFDRQILASYSLSELEKERGNYEQAFNYRSFYGEHIDSVVSLHKMPEIERLAYKYELELGVIKERARTNDIIQYAVSSALILLLLFLLIIQRIHRRRKIARLMYESHIAGLNEQIALQQAGIERSKKDLIQLRLTQQHNEKEIAQKEQEIRKMIDEKEKLRNWFFMQTPIYKKIEALKNQKIVTSKEVQVLLQPDQIILKTTLFEIYGEYVKYLQSTFLQLTEEDYIYLCLKLCDLDDQTIAYCYGNSSKQIVVQRRWRLKEKMASLS